MHERSEKENRKQREYLRARSKSRYDPLRVISHEREDRRAKGTTGFGFGIGRKGNKLKDGLSFEPELKSHNTEEGSTLGCASGRAMGDNLDESMDGERSGKPFLKRRTMKVGA